MTTIEQLAINIILLFIGHLIGYSRGKQHNEEYIYELEEQVEDYDKYIKEVVHNLSEMRDTLQTVVDKNDINDK